MVKYFFTAVTVPENELWVNLSPYEGDRMIPEALGNTEMGRDMLAQDYMLKQLSSSLIYPEKDLGKKFWARIYDRVEKEYGTREIPVNTFNKVWIVPEEAVVYEEWPNAFVSESRLKVMLEEDYLALKRNMDNSAIAAQTLEHKDVEDVNRLSSTIVKEIVLPEIEKEVNQGRTFARLRQVYHAMILAAWYKRRLRESLLGSVYFDQNKVVGVDLADKQMKFKIYERYLEAFRKGVFNFIKEDYYTVRQEHVPRKYFSGGERFARLFTDPDQLRVETDRSMLGAESRVLQPYATDQVARLSVQGLDVGEAYDPQKADASVPVRDYAMLGGPEQLYVIGNGKINFQGSVQIKGNRSQIKFLGENQEALALTVGNGLFMEDGFISFRQTMGAARIEGQPDTAVVEAMTIGKNVRITRGGEVVNVLTIGDDVVIDGAAVIELDEGVGARTRIVGNSDVRMSAIGSDVLIDRQSKIFKAVIQSGAAVVNSSIIGGHDELTPGWRLSDEGGRGRGVIVGQGAEIYNSLIYHKGTDSGRMNPIRIAEGVVLDGVFVVSERNEGVDIQTSLKLSPDQRVYLYDGVRLDDALVQQIEHEHKTNNIVTASVQEGTLVVQGRTGAVRPSVLRDVLSLKEQYREEWTQGIPRVLSVETTQQAQDLNEQLLTSSVDIDRQGNVIAHPEEGQDIALTIGQGAFVYPGLEVYARRERRVVLNLLEIGSRGGAVIVADQRDVHLGPVDRLAGRIANTVLRDVNVTAEFNNFGGIADDITGNAKTTIRNQGILEHARVSTDGTGRGEIIWGWFQGRGLVISVKGDKNVGLTHGGIVNDALLTSDSPIASYREVMNMNLPTASQEGALNESLNLKSVNRRGWLPRPEANWKGVDHPEKVSDHTWGMAVLLLALAQEGLDLDKALSMLLLHDLAEAGLKHDYMPGEIDLDEKHKIERDAFSDLVAPFSNREALISLYDEYEKRESPEARFVKGLDLLDMFIQALVYDRRYQGVGFSEFVNNARRGLIDLEEDFLLKITDLSNTQSESAAVREFFMELARNKDRDQGDHDSTATQHWEAAWLLLVTMPQATSPEQRLKVLSTAILKDIRIPPTTEETVPLAGRLAEYADGFDDSQVAKAHLVAERVRWRLREDIQQGINSAPSSELRPTPTGGIDFNAELFDLQIKRDEGGIPLPASRQSFEDIHIEGILPVIINISPVNLPLLMGDRETNPPVEKALSRL